MDHVHYDITLQHLYDDTGDSGTLTVIFVRRGGDDDDTHPPNDGRAHCTRPAGILLRAKDVAMLFHNIVHQIICALLSAVTPKNYDKLFYRCFASQALVSTSLSTVDVIVSVHTKMAGRCAKMAGRYERDCGEVKFGENGGRAQLSTLIQLATLDRQCALFMSKEYLVVLDK